MPEIFPAAACVLLAIGGVAAQTSLPLASVMP